jgi:hypothetical protein
LRAPELLGLTESSAPRANAASLARCGDVRASRSAPAASHAAVSSACSRSRLARPRCRHPGGGVPDRHRINRLAVGHALERGDSGRARLSAQSRLFSRGSSHRGQQVPKADKSEDSRLPRLGASHHQAASTCGEPGERARQQPERVRLTESHVCEVDHDIVHSVPAGHVQRRAQRRQRHQVQLATQENHDAVSGCL